MPSSTLRLTLINNAKQTQRSGVLLKLNDGSDAIAELLTLARNKLRLKRAKTLYLTQGIELTDHATWFAHARVPQDSLVYVSCGEAYAGPKPEQPDDDMNKTNDATTTGDSRMDPSSSLPAVITVLAKESFVDPEAEAQLKRVALLPGMRRVVGQPDLHPGQATPVGATFITQNIIYPGLIGNDIGCGMAVYKTRLSSNIRPQKIVDRLVGLEGRWSEGDPHQFLTDHLRRANPSSSVEEASSQPMFSEPYLDQLGTLGGGNHFAEFVIVESLVDPALCAALDISDDKTYLIVHTGSRKFGQAVLDASRRGTTVNNSNNITLTNPRQHCNAAQEAKGKDQEDDDDDAHVSARPSSSAAAAAAAEKSKPTSGIDPDSPAGQTYLAQHDLACQWARANRELVAHRVLSRLNADQDAVKLLDIWHNHVERKLLPHAPHPSFDHAPTLSSSASSPPPAPSCSSSSSSSSSLAPDHASTYWIHRKGAAPSDRGLVIIPGSRGHFSYLVMPHPPSSSSSCSSSSSSPSNHHHQHGLENGFSLAHGAGRQLARSKALQRRPVGTSRQASVAALQTTALGSMVVCEDPDLLLEEQPDAYKDISHVIHDLAPFAKVVAILRPIATYKMRNEKQHHHRS